MQSAVETLSPTRVRLTVDVPFEELRPSLDQAYRRVAGQVRVPGFRPGHVPPRVLDVQVGRGAILEEALQDAVPRFYGQALEEHSVQAIGQPEVEVTKLEDGVEMSFTAEVDVRPEVSLPVYTGLPVTVDDADATDELVDEQLSGLRERYAVLSAVERPVETGDVVTLDLVTTVDGDEVPGGSATELSYEVGTETLLPGLDEAIAGAPADETRTFTTDITQGDFAGRTADVAATVRTVKVKELPELDDEFAETASEFDTIEELRADVVARVSRMRRLEQGVQARDRVLEVLLERTDVPLPESIVTAELGWRDQSLVQQLEQAGMTLEDYLESQSETAEEHAAHMRTDTEQAVKAQLVLDAVAAAEQLQVSPDELTDQVVRRARQAGLAPDAYAQRMVDAGNLPAIMSEILRGKALATILQAAVVTDESGRRVDLAELDAEVAEHTAQEVAELAEPVPVGTEDTDDTDTDTDTDTDGDGDGDLEVVATVEVVEGADGVEVDVVQVEAREVEAREVEADEDGSGRVDAGAFLAGGPSAATADPAADPDR